ncbi:hypothetical protein Sfulv_48190 [Streptomyces fulvorobeus]|uniref:Uncharacterized protein n=1 Tax=Streptomyces fulvorobeus TaxID=284028 RepID=A0A7J0CC93_9ACTN|nr:hypothetical protein Sfulv_48190 [Streptomyces fulvorobeus]
MGEPDIPYVGLVVDPVPGPRIAARADQPGALPGAQRRGPDSEPARERPDERAAALSRRLLGLRCGLQVAQCALHGVEGPPVVEELCVALVDHAVRVVGCALVHGPHDRRRRPVAVAGQEGEKRAQRRRVPRGVGAVAVGGATGGRKDAGLLVIPDRLRGQVVFARQINRPQVFTPLKLSSHDPQDIRQKSQPDLQR